MQSSSQQQSHQPPFRTSLESLDSLVSKPSLSELCIGCLKQFQQGQTLPPQGIHIQYKNYYLPVREHQQRWILLKTIVAFLNSKGGTIYMGVDDATRQVVGVMAELKQQDQFMLELDPLLDQIKPDIDLRHKEQVRVQFVPVLKNRMFQGKYVIKIIVKQGDPSKLYHFAQTVKVQNEDRKHHQQQFQVIWGFYRLNMGKVQSIRGTDLLKEVYDKAKRPSEIVQTFHQGCNPEPKRVSARNMNIGFKHVSIAGRDDKGNNFKDDLIENIQIKLKRDLRFAQNDQYVLEEVTFSEVYGRSQQKMFGSQKSIPTSEDQKPKQCTLLIKFQSITDFKLADNYITNNIKDFSNLIPGKERMIDVGFTDNTHFYKIGLESVKLRYGKGAAGYNEKSRSKSKSKASQKVTQESPSKKAASSSQNQIKLDGPPFLFVLSNLKNNLSKEQMEKFITILQLYLQKYCGKNEYEINDNSIINNKSKNLTDSFIIEFKTSQSRAAVNAKLAQQMLKDRDFTVYFSNFLVFWGIPSGKILIHHYDKNTRNIFKKEVQNSIRSHTNETGSIDVEFIKGKVGYYLEICLEKASGLGVAMKHLQGQIQANQEAKEGKVEQQEKYDIFSGNSLKQITIKIDLVRF